MKNKLKICILTFALLILSGCASMIDFRDKAVALETKVLGMEITIPDVFMGGGGSFLTMRLGWVSVKYASAPSGSSVNIDDQYKDLSFWKLAGNISSVITLTNTTSKYPADAPLK